MGVATVVLSCTLQILCVVGSLTAPFLLQQIIDFIDRSQQLTLTQRIYQGGVLLLALIAVDITTSLLSQYIEMQQMVSGVQSISAMGSMVYQKCLRISGAASKQYNQGKLMNLMQMDCMRVSTIVNQVSTGIQLVVTLGLSMYLLFHFLGAVVLAGVGICLVSIVINYFVARVNRRYQQRVMSLKDERIKKTTEALQSVKMLKMYGWCDLFMSFIADVRKREVATMQFKAFLSGIYICALYLFPKLVSIGTFFIYAAVNTKISLGVIFAAINVFNIMAVSSVSIV